MLSQRDDSFVPPSAGSRVRIRESHRAPYAGHFGIVAALTTATVRVRFWCASKMVFNFAIRLLRLSRHKNTRTVETIHWENYEDSFPITIFIDPCFRNAAVSLRPRAKSEAAG
jgi:hypothetical protein